jgi:hypothetical protein
MMNSNYVIQAAEAVRRTEKILAIAERYKTFGVAEIHGDVIIFNGTAEERAAFDRDMEKGWLDE